MSPLDYAFEVNLAIYVYSNSLKVFYCRDTKERLPDEKFGAFLSPMDINVWCAFILISIAVPAITSFIVIKFKNLKQLLVTFRLHVGLSFRIVLEQHSNLNKMFTLFSFGALLVTTGYRSGMTSMLTLPRLPSQYETAKTVLAANYKMHCSSMDIWNFGIPSWYLNELIPGIFKDTCLELLEMKDMALRPRLPEKFAGVLSFTDQAAKVFLSNLKLWNPGKSCNFVQKDVSDREVYFTHYHHLNYKTIKFARLFLEIGVHKRFENIYEGFSMAKKSNLAKSDAELVKSGRDLKYKDILKLKEFIPALYILIAGIITSCVVYFVRDFKRSEILPWNFFSFKLFKSPLKISTKTIHIEVSQLE